MDSDSHIIIDQQELDHLTSLWKLQWKKEPQTKDLKAIIDNYLRQEVFYREALKIKLDHNDAIIRKRLAQKMEAVANDLSTLMSPPTEQALMDYFQSNQSLFMLPPAVQFEQVLFLSDEPNVETSISQVLKTLQQGEPIPETRSQKLAVSNNWELTPQNIIDNSFGKSFREALNTAPLNTWFGPVDSGYGKHLVKVVYRQDSTLPDFEQVKEYVAREYEYQSVLQAQDKIYKDLLENYTVMITADIPDLTLIEGLANNQ
ncbi:peptidyl-prolyl cis-trans isomerase [Thalassotalea ponticola]|uniref:peptidyl-prolyl cis-trans isomerase n=1 Tax=Thalassotalea ponticola TaxID=1523392 RepID=UPI0025B3B8E4|nr:peptidyl-prolyl cis-trans isomerase [Thalassotalea ponticola]MDN3651423.1 peptidyl-prolyl cis-trans isomerase [Thalassotalea ponticola]